MNEIRAIFAVRTGSNVKRSGFIAFLLSLLISAAAYSEPGSTSGTTVPGKTSMPVIKERVVEPKIVAPATATGKTAAKIDGAGTSTVAATNTLCLASKTAVVSGKQGMGCRETPPGVWQKQGCPASAGCCTAATGCLVSGTRGDGVY